MKTILVSFTLAVAVSSCVSPSGPSGAGDTVTIEGRVWGRAVYSTTVAGPATYVDPVSGAVVSTTLDSATTTTDANGFFVLKTNTGPAKNYSCSAYTVTITAAGHPTFSVTGTWGSHPKDQVISLTPPQPTSVSCNPR